MHGSIKRKREFHLTDFRTHKSFRDMITREQRYCKSSEIVRRKKACNKSGSSEFEKWVERSIANHLGFARRNFESVVLPHGRN